jgi:hypothetical protein
MNQTANLRPAQAGSDRVRLARLARDAALRVPGVAGTDAGRTGRFVTVGDGQHLPGVLCVAGTGGYDVSLRLVCELVPLAELGERVRAAVRRSAAGLPLESVSIHVAGLVGPEGV